MKRGQSANSKTNGHSNSISENERSVTIAEQISKDKNILFELKQQRKQIEEDVQLLANRVHLLEAEEKKALKKIEETKNKARSVLEAKRIKFEQSKAKMLQRLKEEEEKCLSIINTNKKKSANKDKIETSKQQLLSRIKTDIDRMRKYKQDQREVATFIRSEEIQKNSEKVQSVKDSENAAKQKRSNLENTKKRPSSAANVRKTEQETHEAWKFKDYDLDSFEKKELKLKEKLKEVQRLQKEVETEFKNAMNQGSSTSSYPTHGFITPLMK